MVLLVHALWWCVAVGGRCCGVFGSRLADGSSLGPVGAGSCWELGCILVLSCCGLPALCSLVCLGCGFGCGLFFALWRSLCTGRPLPCESCVCVRACVCPCVACVFVMRLAVRVWLRVCFLCRLSVAWAHRCGECLPWLCVCVCLGSVGVIPACDYLALLTRPAALRVAACLVCGPFSWCFAIVFSVRLVH